MFWILDFFFLFHLGLEDESYSPSLISSAEYYAALNSLEKRIIFPKNMQYLGFVRYKGTW